MKQPCLGLVFGEVERTGEVSIAVEGGSFLFCDFLRSLHIGNIREIKLKQLSDFILLQ